MTMPGEAVIVKIRRPDLTTCTVDGELVILDRAAGYVHHLNPTASEIWEACDGRHSAADIAARLQERFNGATGTVLEDVETTLAQLDELGLLVDANATITMQ
jgi:PqqD family protein of HPr-rel-A system